jgi:hypothetical protein
MNSLRGIPDEVDGPRTRVDMGATGPASLEPNADSELSKTNAAVEEAIAEAAKAANPGKNLDTPPPAAPEQPAPDAGQEPPTQ